MTMVVALLLTTATLSAQLRLASPIANGMVLLQSSEAKLWGEATSGATISVTTSWDNHTHTTKADKSGRWELSVATPEGGYTPYSIHFSDGKEHIAIGDVLIGEIWLASGQSNMEMPLRGFFNSPVEGANRVFACPAGSDRVRMFNVKLTQSHDEERYCEGVWLHATPAEVKEMSATAYFFAAHLSQALDVPVGILNAAYGGAKVESWTPRDVLEGYDDVNLSREAIDAMTTHYYRPMVMYNAMLCPLRGYTIRGFIWYQGCSNVGEDGRFVERMTNMVNAWREDWNDDKECRLPFYTVEIAPYRYKSSEQYESAALLREAQHEAARTIKNAAIVVTNDLVEPFEKDNIHPMRKEPVGERLAWLALHRDYGFEHVACYSPEAVEAVALPNSNEIGVRLSHVPNGLNRWRDIEGLEVAGSEGIFYPVTFAYFEWDSRLLRVRSEYVHDPQVVRYGWGDFKPGNLASCEGLPVAPFEVRLNR